MVAEHFPAWLKVLDRMIRSLPTTAVGLPELRSVRDQVSRYLSHQEGQPELIEQEVRTVAARHGNLLVESVDQVVNDIFRLIDPEIDRFEAARQEQGLTDQDKADGKAYISQLEECNRILEEMKRDQQRVPAQVP